MSEKYVAEYVEIIDDNGERKGVCVTDTEHTVSFEVKDEYVAMELCGLLNKQQATIDQLNLAIDDLLSHTSCDEIKKENEQLRQVVEEYRKTNKHLSELCADASKNGYLPPLGDLQ